MRALSCWCVVIAVHASVAVADPPGDPPPPDPGDAVAPDAPPLAPPPAPSPVSAPAPQWGRTLPLVELDPYPEALVDRPLTLLPGMTQLSGDYEFASTTTKVFTNRTPDIAVRHSFGVVEVRADLGEYATLAAAIPLGSSTALSFGADLGAPQKDDSLHVAQFVDLGYKAYVAPGQCALFFAVGASYNENRIVEPFNLVWTQVVVTAADAELEVQLLPTLALDLGLQFQLPVEASQELVTRSLFNASGSLLATVGHSWDLYANGGLIDLATNRLPYLAFGFVKRWGG